MTIVPKGFPMTGTVEFREAMRQVASGVAIVTTLDGDQRYGITATSAASVSEEPPLISIGINKQSWICDALMRSGRFCINILGASQLYVARAFSTSPRETRFESGEWTSLTTGAPVLVQAPAVFDCELFQAIEVKTHFLVIGHIVTTRTEDNIAPLIYRDRKYVTVGEMQA